MFFLRTESGYILHFTTEEKDHKNQFYTNWFTLPLHEDAVDCLKTIGRLPPTTTRDLIDELKSHKDCEELVEDLKGENQELKGENQELKGKVDGLEGKVDDLQGENQDLKAKLEKILQLLPSAKSKQ